MRRTKEDAERTRAAILDTAERLFCEGGVTQTSLETIARQAGVTRGAVYWHFKDKHDILHALRERCALPHEPLLRAAAEGGHPDPLVLLRSAGMEMLELFEQDEHRQRLFQIMAGVAADDDTLSALRYGREDMHRVLHGLIRQVELSGKLNGGFSSEEAAVLLSASMNGLLSEWLHGGKQFRLTELGGRILARIVETICGPPAGADTK